MKKKISQKTIIVLIVLLAFMNFAGCKKSLDFEFQSQLISGPFSTDPNIFQPRIIKSESEMQEYILNTNIAGFTTALKLSSEIYNKSFFDSKFLAVRIIQGSSSERYEPKESKIENDTFIIVLKDKTPNRINADIVTHLFIAEISNENKASKVDFEITSK